MDEHDRHVRFRLPDAVVAARVSLDEESVWMTDEDPLRAVMLRVEGTGRFVRALLPIHLTGGYTVTFGAWVEVDDDSRLEDALDVWWSPEYEKFSLDGRLANALPVWGLRDSPVTASVLNPEHTPYIVASSDQALQSVLTREWPHQLLLSALPN